jgi:hypothetical protein
MKNIFLFAVLIFTASFTASSAKALDKFPSPQVRERMIQDLVRTMTRLDGEALYVRQNRAQTWTDTTQAIAQEATLANSGPELYRAFMRVNQAYPNLHSNLKPGADFKLFSQKPLRLKAEFQANWLAPHKVTFSISKVDADLNLAAEVKPQVGDSVIAINGRDIQDWTKENFEFCKFPLKEQCDTQLHNQLLKEFLSWNRTMPLSLTLQRGHQTWSVIVPTEEATDGPQETVKMLTCKYDSNRYDGFKIVYAGNRLCIFENPADPDTAVMRITSFIYDKTLLEPNETIKSVTQEIDGIYPWWQTNAKWKHLIIDVIDNHGGNAPVPYYQILLQNDFQEQYVTYKKSVEMADPILRRGFFWTSVEQELWFQSMVTDGTWDRLAIGEYTPAVPMFCAQENQDCRIGKFSPRTHPFQGRVSVLLNQWCVSSCDAFAYTMHEEFGAKARFFGQPQAADSAYSRIALHLVWDEQSADGYHLVMTPIYDPAPANTLITQTIVVTQSVTADGRIVSGKPVPLTDFVPSTLANKNRWPNSVLSKALDSN